MSEDDTSTPTKGNGWLPDFSSWAREVATKSVMTPLQWVLAIVAAATLPGMIFAPDAWIRGGLFAVLFGCVVYVLWAFDFFKRNSPERLQSENYRYQQSQLAQRGRLLLDERRRAEKFKTIDGTLVANTQAIGMDDLQKREVIVREEEE